MHLNIRRRFYYSKRKNRHSIHNKRLLQISVIIFTAIIFTLYLFNSRFKPLILMYAEHEAKNIICSLINSQIEKELTTNSQRYSDFISLEKDANGKICAITTNMSAMNTFKVHVTESILSEASALKAFNLKIPTGALLGSEFFAGYGPSIPVKVVPFTSLNSSYFNAFSSAGINQTRHQIMMNFTADVGILFPGFSESMHINTDICIAETVIVGTTPQLVPGYGVADNKLFSENKN